MRLIDLVLAEVATRQTVDKSLTKGDRDPQLLLIVSYVTMQFHLLGTMGSVVRLNRLVS